jgi:hypothetical protein|tara:strand:+ start:99 stop:257 length:159 start_codon:yes stop_codon:yes gene_type:complete
MTNAEMREVVYTYHIQEFDECTHEEITEMVDDIMEGDYNRWFDEEFCGKRSI